MILLAVPERFISSIDNFAKIRQDSMPTQNSRTYVSLFADTKHHDLCVSSFQHLDRVKPHKLSADLFR